MKKQEFLKYCLNTYGTSPDYPFDEDFETAVLRHTDNRKWYAIVMKVSRRKFGFDSDEMIDVVNLKLPTEMFGSFGAADGVYEYMIFTVRESTLESYGALIKNQVKPFIGNKPLSALTTSEMQKFYNKIKKEGRVREHPIHGKTLADSMVRGIHMMLHEALDMAVKERLVVKNPTNGTTVPKCNYADKQVLGDSQLDIFLDAIKAYPEWTDFFYAEVMTGLRKGEICGLKWSDVDFDGGKLHVQRAVTRQKGGIRIGETKTDTGMRVITLPPSVLDMLTRRKAEALSEWIFYKFTNPCEPMPPDAAYRKLKVILKNAELPLIRFHDLRHTFATHATDGGVDPKTLSGILGHTNASFTLDTYTHVTTDMQKKASVVVGNMMKNMKIGD